MLFVLLFDLCLFGFVGFLFLLVSGKSWEDCGTPWTFLLPFFFFRNYFAEMLTVKRRCVARNTQDHQDLHYWPFNVHLLTCTFICISEGVQIRKWNIPFQNSRMKVLNITNMRRWPQQRGYVVCCIQIWLTLAMQNKLRCHAHCYFQPIRLLWSTKFVPFHILNDKHCRSR